MTVTDRNERYVIQVRVPKGTWMDMHPFLEDTTDAVRRNMLNAYRQRVTSGEWRLIRRIIIEEDVEAAATGTSVPR